MPNRRTATLGVPDAVVDPAPFRHHEVHRLTPRELRYLSILEGPLHEGETATEWFARKERELGNAFAELSVADARLLDARLRLHFHGDPVADRFAQLGDDRQGRLLGFLRLLY